jgi:DNA-binding transcriptional MerR regulator
MRVSELVDASGVPLASIKYYLREGLLMPGTATSATQADYGQQHVRRLRLIKALTDVVGLSVSKARDVLALIDEPGELFDSLGLAVAALPPYVDERADYPRARAALATLGQLYDPRFAATAQFERALEAAEAAGLAMDDTRLRAYGRHIAGIAEADLSVMPEDAASAIEYAVLGTALYEPVLVAMRRLAHQDIAAKRMPTPGLTEPE